MYQFKKDTDLDHLCKEFVPNPLPYSLQKFWVIWNVKRGLPHKMHFSYREAEQEVERLCEKHPYEAFYILKSDSAHFGKASTIVVDKKIYAK